MKKLLAILAVLFLVFCVLVVAAILLVPRFTKLDPVAVVGDAVTGYGANSDRHKNAQQLPTPWDPIGDANRRVEAIPMEDRAYPLIAEAAAMLEAADVNALLRAEPGEEGWEKTVAWVRSDEAQAIIGVLKQAMQKPESGFPLSDVEGEVWDQARVKHGLVPNGGTATNQPMTLSVLLPALGKMRYAARLLTIDARLSIEDGDADRFAESVGTAIGLTTHGYGLDWLIQQMVNYSILELACQAIEHAIRYAPELVTESIAAGFEHAVWKAADGGVTRLRTDAETQIIEDQMRRFVDDQGVFNGTSFTNAAAAVNTGVGAAVASSVATESINADLLATLSEAERWAAKAEQSARPVYTTMDGYDESVEAWASASDSIPGRVGRLVYGIVTPAWPSAIRGNRYAEQQLTALRVALAAHRHRLRHGDPPLGLSDIDDDLLPFDPIDGFTGGPMQLRWRDGAPFVYTFGPDGDDDGGVHVPNRADGKAWRGIPDALLEAEPDGDFVLFPAQDE